MKYYKCDQCGAQERGWAPSVHLIGIGRKTGVLGNGREQHFCSPKCFWEFAKAKLPYAERGALLTETK